MTLPPYPGQPQPEEPQEPAAPETPPAPATPPPPPAGAPAPPPPVAPPAGPPPPIPAAPAYPAMGGATPPPAPPGGPLAPPPAYQPYAGPNDGNAGYSALAIASFVCSLTCCLGIPAVILGAIGIAKTGPGKARGRWMAITGIVLGVLGTVLLVIGAIAVFAVSDRVVTPENARAGQCVQAKTTDNTVTMVDLGCSVDHNGQIFAVVTPTASDEAADRSQMQLCLTRIAGAFPGAEVRAVDGAPRLNLHGEEVEVAAASAHSALQAGSPVACWVEATDGVLDDDVVD